MAKADINTDESLKTLASIAPQLQAINILTYLLLQEGGQGLLDEEIESDFDCLHCFMFAEEMLDKISEALESLQLAIDRGNSKSSFAEFELAILYTKNYYYMARRHAGENYPDIDRSCVFGLAKSLSDKLVDLLEAVISDTKAVQSAAGVEQ